MQRATGAGVWATTGNTLHHVLRVARKVITPLAVGMLSLAAPGSGKHIEPSHC